MVHLSWRNGEQGSTTCSEDQGRRAYHALSKRSMEMFMLAIEENERQVDACEGSRQAKEILGLEETQLILPT